MLDYIYNYYKIINVAIILNICMNVWVQKEKNNFQIQYISFYETPSIYFCKTMHKEVCSGSLYCISISDSYSYLSENLKIKIYISSKNLKGSKRIVPSLLKKITYLNKVFRKYKLQSLNSQLDNYFTMRLFLRHAIIIESLHSTVRAQFFAYFFSLSFNSPCTQKFSI